MRVPRLVGVVRERKGQLERHDLAVRAAATAELVVNRDRVRRGRGPAGRQIVEPRHGPRERNTNLLVSTWLDAAVGIDDQYRIRTATCQSE